MRMRRLGSLAAVGAALFLGVATAAAQEAAGPAPEQVAMDTLWVLFAAAFVFLMQAGFALLEAGPAGRKERGQRSDRERNWAISREEALFPKFQVLGMLGV